MASSPVGDASCAKDERAMRASRAKKQDDSKADERFMRWYTLCIVKCRMRSLNSCSLVSVHPVSPAVSLDSILHSPPLLTFISILHRPFPTLPVGPFIPSLSSVSLSPPDLLSLSPFLFGCVLAFTLETFIHRKSSLESDYGGFKRRSSLVCNNKQSNSKPPILMCAP
jgi:hypothetical protein